jgi:phenylalanyl-tRNA synthetase beta chain
MKFSYNWLSELHEGPAIGPEEIARLITVYTAECEGVEEAGADHVIEVDNKSLTHRPDLWGHHGMAREIAAILRHTLLDPVQPVAFPETPAPVAVAIEDYFLCQRYSALVFEDVRVQPSPAWMRERLTAVGLNPINNIVDVTNYVMAEIAQPMHAFDADKLRGGEIIVRPAQPDEEFAALNGESYQLNPSNLVIADTAGAVALGGVIGGAGSAISEATTRIVLESANFNAASIRKTTARLKLRTDASMRFEKAQDPVNTVRGLERAYRLLQEVSPGIRLAGGLADAYRPLPPPEPILLPLDWLDRKLGRSVPQAEVRRILESLAFEVAQPHRGVFSVRPPSWRATKDISIKDDLVEEVGRMVGYASITPAAPLAPARVPPANPERAFHHAMREMARAQGFTEVYNYSFVSDEMVRAFGLDPAEHVQVQNPIAADQNLLRSSLLPGVWKNINDNARHLEAFRLFEIGNEIYKDGPDREARAHLVAAVYAKDDGVAGLFELKRLAECLLPGCAANPAVGRAFEHPRRAAEIRHADTVAGRLFEFHPRMVNSGRAAVLDLDLALVEKLQPAAVRYKPLRRYPSSAFDLSVVAKERALAGDIQAALARLAGEHLLSIGFLRDFTLPDRTRSVSFRLTVGASNRTLSAEEVGAMRSRVIDGMRALGYELRL